MKNTLDVDTENIGQLFLNIDTENISDDEINHMTSDNSDNSSDIQRMFMQ